MVADWDDEGEIDLLDWFAELTIYTSSACLIGSQFREELDGRFAAALPRPRAGHRRHRLRRPVRRHRELPHAATRPASALVALVQAIMDQRTAERPAARRRPRPARRADVDQGATTAALRFSADEVTGMFISMMFAGHHTTSGTAAWTLIELLRNPERDGQGRRRARRPLRRRRRGQLPGPARDPAPGGGHQGGAAAAPAADPAAARGHRATSSVAGHHDRRRGRSSAPRRRCRTASPEAFADPDAFDPTATSTPRQDDVANPWTWIPFGAGRHRCVGAAFAMMQLKAIFCGAAPGLGVRGRPAAGDATATTTPRWSSSSPSPAAPATAARRPCRPARPAMALAHRRRPRPVPGPRRVRARGPRGVRGVRQGRGRPCSTRPRPTSRARRGRAAVKYCPTHALSIVERADANRRVTHAAFPRAELEEMVERWLQANRDAEAAGDWKPMADLYTEDATYGWNYGARRPTSWPSAATRSARSPSGLEMDGLDGWEYPYEEIVIDEAKGMVIGFWRQIADATRADGSRYEIAGIGGIWFRYGGDFQWRWQRDWFDFGNAAAAVHGDDDRRHAVGGHDRPHEPLDEAGPARLLPRRTRRPSASGSVRRERRPRRTTASTSCSSTASWVRASGGGTFETLNPATEEVLGVAADGTAGRHGRRHRRGPPGLRRDRLVHRPRAPGALPPPAPARPCQAHGDELRGPDHRRGRRARASSPPAPQFDAPVADLGVRRRPRRGLRVAAPTWATADADGRSRATAGCSASRSAWSAPITPVELPAPDQPGQGRPGPGRRLHGRAEAGARHPVGGVGRSARIAAERDRPARPACSTS